MPFEKGHKHGNRFDKDNQPSKEKVGRKKTADLLALLREALVKEVKEGVTVQDVIINKLVNTAGKGDLRAINMVLDRIHGKAVETVNTTNTNTTPTVYILPADNSKPPVTNEADVDTEIE